MVQEPIVEWYYISFEQKQHAQCSIKLIIM